MMKFVEQLVQPKPTTGHRSPDYSQPNLADRMKYATAILRTTKVIHRPQQDLIEELKLYRDEVLGVRGELIDGRRLSQEFQAGKSTTAELVVDRLAKERAAEGLPPNKYQVIMITCTTEMTLKEFYLAILEQMDDDFLKPKDGKARKYDNRSASALQRQIGEWILALDVELLILDEIQNLHTKGGDPGRVTKRLQEMLEKGVAPLVLIGNEHSAAFFESNEDLCARLAKPLELKALNAEDDDAQLFEDFCNSFDDMLVERNIFPTHSGLGTERMMDGLYDVSSGHIGRVARIVKHSVLHAIKRGASHIDLYDLSCITRDFAYGLGWTDTDPFSRRPMAK